MEINTNSVPLIISIFGSWAALVGLLVNIFTNVLKKIEGKLDDIKDFAAKIDKVQAVSDAEVTRMGEQIDEINIRCKELHRERFESNPRTKHHNQ